MTNGSTSRGRGRWFGVLAAVLALVGAVALTIAATGQQAPPQPSAADAGTVAAESAVTAPVPLPGPEAVPTPAASAAPAPPSSPTPEPASISIPAIGVRSDLLRLGLNDDGTVEVPPFAADSQAGWYTGSPAPGAVGPSLILGHVDSAEYGAQVFFKLGALKPGNSVQVTRVDGSTAVYTVDGVVSYPKADFPTLKVYGNTPNPQLRLITCGGVFDRAARSYVDNIVVYATLTGVLAG